MMLSVMSQPGTVPDIDSSEAIVKQKNRPFASSCSRAKAQGSQIFILTPDSWLLTPAPEQYPSQLAVPRPVWQTGQL